MKLQWDKKSVEVDQWFSYTNYLKVLEVDENMIKVKDKENKDFHISKNIFYEEM